MPASSQSPWIAPPIHILVEIVKANLTATTARNAPPSYSNRTAGDFQQFTNVPEALLIIPELTIRYDDQLRPISGQCSTCGQQMPPPPADLRDSADIVMWFSGHFIEHRKQKHPTRLYGERL